MQSSLRLNFRCVNNREKLNFESRKLIQRSISSSHLFGLSNVSREMRIRGCGAQPQILDRTADGEMVEALPIVVGHAERAVQHIIEVAANAGAAKTRSLGS